MKVGARITVATSLVVTATLGTYAYLNMRAEAKDRRVAVEREARDFALGVKASLEARGIDKVIVERETFAATINRAGTPWRIAILPRELVQQADAGKSPQLKRLRTIVDVPELHLAAQEGERFIYVVPLRRTSLQVVGALEVSRSTAFLDSGAASNQARTLAVVAAIVALTVLMIWWFTRSLMTRPVAKLLAGIDDVAKGDLSHVLLSERDDEIGALATRFNEMTFSLRESRGETQRQHEAKLRLEHRLGQTEKLATIGQLAAEIAHEVGTPLNVIAGRAKNLGRKAGDVEAVQKNARIIADQTARITRIIQRLLDFTRRKVGTPESRAVQLNEITLTTMELLETKLSAAKIRTSLTRAEGLPPVTGDADRLQQVVINLVLNAAQAMPEGGALQVETSLVTRRRPGLESAPEQTYALLEITDSGVGIPEADRDRIFEPFYTSKGDTGGTGLGLSVCYGIVKEHDGWIDVDDVDGGGTVFRVYLPVE